MEIRRRSAEVLGEWVCATQGVAVVQSLIEGAASSVIQITGLVAKSRDASGEPPDPSAFSALLQAATRGKP